LLRLIFKMTFKENWEKTDELCATCSQVIKRQRGITRQNIKRLLVPRWDMNEVLITFMIIMVLFLAYAYANETKQSREWLKPMFEGTKETCLMVCSSRCEMGFYVKDPYLNLNLTNITIWNDSSKSG
jgi:hypothetical protein